MASDANKEMSRSEYTLKNTTISILMQVVKNLVGFVSRTIFIKVLGAEYLGVNGLFSDISFNAFLCGTWNWQCNGF